MVRSALQKKVLKQYRDFLRISWNQPDLRAHVRHEFKRQSTSVPRSDFLLVEHLLRRGDKQLKMLSKDSVDAVSYFGGKSRT